MDSLFALRAVLVAGTSQNAPPFGCSLVFADHLQFGKVLHLPRSFWASLTVKVSYCFDYSGAFPACHAGSRGFEPAALSPLNTPRSNSTDFPRLDLRGSRLVPRDSGILKP